MSQSSQELLSEIFGIPIKDRIKKCANRNIHNSIGEIKHASSFLSNNCNNKQNVCDNNQFTSTRESFSENKSHNINNKLKNSSLDQHFKCKKLYFGNPEKENGQKVASVKKDTKYSFNDRAKDLSPGRDQLKNYDFSHSNEDIIRSKLVDGNSFNDKGNVDKKNYLNKQEVDNTSLKRSHDTITNENKECFSANSSNEQTTHYQKLLEDDLDLFQALITCSNDEFVDLLCSISSAKETLDSKKKTDPEEKLLQLNYVREVDKSKLRSTTISQSFNNTQQSQSRTLCERCSAEILSSSQNNSQKEYRFKYVREITRSSDGNVVNDETRPKYRRLNSRRSFNQEGFMCNSVGPRNKSLLEERLSGSSGEKEGLNIRQRDLELQDSKLAENESDFTSLHSLSTVKRKKSFPFSICIGLNKKYQEELQKIQEEASCQIFQTPNHHTEMDPTKHISLSNEITTGNTQKSVSFSWDSSQTPNISSQNLVPINDHTKLLEERSILENTQQPFNSSWRGSQTPNTSSQNLEGLNKYVRVQDVENSTSFYTPTLSGDNIFVPALKQLNSQHRNESTFFPSQNLTKIYEPHSNCISQSTSTKRIQILQNIFLDDTCDILNTVQSNNDKGCVIPQNYGLKYHNSNIPTPASKTEIYAKVVPSKKKKAHILKKNFTQNVSYEKENYDPREDVYLTDLDYLKEFLREKLQDVREYLHKCENEQNGGNKNTYINILNNLNNSNEETFLGTLESQDIFSQPLSYTPTLINRASLRCSQTSERNTKKNPSSFDDKLANVIDNFTTNKALISQSIYDIHIPENIKKMFILRKISDIFIKLLNDIENQRIPMLPVTNIRAWGNCEFDGVKSMLIPSVDSKTSKISLQNRNNRSKFNLTVFIMGKIADLLINNNFCTKRELYYQVKNFVKHQIQINTTVDLISCIIEEPPWDFGILATQKGLVYGDLTITLSGNEIINCSTSGGTLVPQNLNKITKVESNASFILIVEKDSIFQKLLDEGLPNRLPRTFIIITGKGFSDVCTRWFIKKLWQILYIPVFALVDADPYGIEIMLTYRFGSLALAHLSNYLALPSLRWIGIRPKEIVSLNITRQALTQRDRRKIHSLLRRPYMDSIPKVREELEVMLQRDFKAEIEGVMKGNNYLTNLYIPSKLYAQDFI